jgi:hypothetical protein
MGLRPTNSDENHVGQAPSLRRPLRPPERGFNKLRWVFDRARVLQDPPFALGISRSKREQADVDVGRRTGVRASGPAPVCQPSGSGSGTAAAAASPRIMFAMRDQSDTVRSLILRAALFCAQHGGGVDMHGMEDRRQRGQ